MDLDAAIFQRGKRDIIEGGEIQRHIVGEYEPAELGKRLRPAANRGAERPGRGDQLLHIGPGKGSRIGLAPLVISNGLLIGFLTG